MTKPKVIGRCIYCGKARVNLTREHIVPFGLGGNIILHQACCDCCREIIQPIEDYCVRTMMGNFRHKHGASSRKRGGKRRPTHLPLHLSRRDGFSKTINTPRESYPAVLYLPYFPPPKLLTNNPQTGTSLWIWSSVADLKSHRELYGQTGFLAGEYNNITFSRMIAKIAHGIAVYGLGLEKLSAYDLLLPDVILNEPSEDKIAAVVGADSSEPRAAKATHSMNIALPKIGNYELIAATVRLFANLGAPTYIAIVGRRELEKGSV